MKIYFLRKARPIWKASVYSPLSTFFFLCFILFYFLKNKFYNFHPKLFLIKEQIN